VIRESSMLGKLRGTHFWAGGCGSRLAASPDGAVCQPAHSRLSHPHCCSAETIKSTPSYRERARWRAAFSSMISRGEYTVIRICAPKSTIVRTASAGDILVRQHRSSRVFSPSNELRATT